MCVYWCCGCFVLLDAPKWHWTIPKAHSVKRTHVKNKMYPLWQSEVFVTGETLILQCLSVARYLFAHPMDEKATKQQQNAVLGYSWSFVVWLVWFSWLVLVDVVLERNYSELLFALPAFQISNMLYKIFEGIALSRNWKTFYSCEWKGFDVRSSTICVRINCSWFQVPYVIIH